MDDTNLRVTTRSALDEGLVLVVEGYLDDDGGWTLAREARAVPVAVHRRIFIDLDAVCLFNCSGARRLISILRELDTQGMEVDLVGVHPSLRMFLDLAA